MYSGAEVYGIVLENYQNLTNIQTGYGNNYYLDLSECMMGRTKANVFPEPVGAETQTSFGLKKNLWLNYSLNTSLFCHRLEGGMVEGGLNKISIQI